MQDKHLCSSICSRRAYNADAQTCWVPPAQQSAHYAVAEDLYRTRVSNPVDSLAACTAPIYHSQHRGTNAKRQRAPVPVPLRARTKGAKALWLWEGVQRVPEAIGGRAPRAFFAEGFMGEDVMKLLLAMARFFAGGDAMTARPPLLSAILAQPFQNLRLLDMTHEKTTDIQGTCGRRLSTGSVAGVGP